MTQRNSAHRARRLHLLWLALLPALACLSLPGVGDPSATETAVAAQVLTELAPTLVAVPPTEPPTEAPANTPEPVIDVAATDAAATAEAALEPILIALSSYGFGPDEGRLGWVHDPVLLEVTEYRSAEIVSDYAAVFVRDFVVQADVIWNTKTGLAGCGFVFRADPTTESSYGFGLFRGGNGVSAFNEWENGVSAEWGRFADVPSADPDNDATNTLAVVAQGARFTFYVNGFQADEVSSTTLAEGSVGFAAFSESGTTTCEFRNGWLWVLE
jgi:hypothetical protein